MLKKLYGITGESAKRVNKAVVYSVLLNITIMFSAGMFVYIIKHIIDGLTGQTATNPLPLMTFVVLVVVFALLIFYLQKIKYYSTYIATYEQSANTRISLAEKIRKLPMSFLTKVDVSELSYTMMSDVTMIEHAVSHALIDAIAIIVTLAIAFVFLMFFNIKLALALFVFFPIGVLAMYLSKKWSADLSVESAKSKIDQADKLQEILENIQVIKANHLTESFNQQINKLGDIVIKKAMKAELYVGTTVMSTIYFVRFGAACSIIYGAYLMTGGQIDVLAYILFVFVATRIFEPLTGVFMMAAEMLNAIVSNKRIQDLENHEILSGDTNVHFDNYDVELKEVNFGYGEEKVIDDISVKISAGKVTALVGPSGSGKSTLSKLIARFWDVDSGKITIGGKDVATVDSDELLKSFSVVFQDVVLFNDTIYNNIAIGRQSATKEEIYQAARDAQCMDFIDKLPNGFETEIGENGYTLSGGERQRLSVARAFLKDAPIILLDEATASVDPENETLIQEAFGRLIKDKTVIVIAHRLRTIKDAHNIVVLDEGKIIEQGRHDELMANEGLYHHMYSLQHQSDQWHI